RVALVTTKATLTPRPFTRQPHTISPYRARFLNNPCDQTGQETTMCVDGMTMCELAVDRLIPAPSHWPEFYSWAHDAFDLSDDSWDPAGGSETWNGSKPYGKMIHAIYLLTYALRDEYVLQWHARNDYLSAARAADNSYHGPFYLRFINGHDA